MKNYLGRFAHLLETAGDQMEIAQAVFEYARMTRAFTDADLERVWDWGDYHEGVRFAFFRAYEDLRQLATRLVTYRRMADQPQTTAQLCLAQYLAAFRDLQAVLLGVDDVLAEQVPAEGEWSVRQVVPHILGAERSFFAVIRYALERSRLADDRPIVMPDEAFDQFWASDGFESQLSQGSLSGLMAYYDAWHQTVLQEFSSVSEAELHLPSIFWESQPMPVEFRLHRFDSHLRQHTVQIEKALESMGHKPSETLRLLRLIYAALAEVEGARLGADEIGKAACEQVGKTIHSQSLELSKG
jgi:uncharacterized damage-inducible protein DinB